MNKELSEKTKEWMQLERKTLEQRKKAEEFYDLYLMKLIEEEYIRTNKYKVPESVDFLVMSVGTSYEPVILNIRLLKPKKILFLYTEKSKHVLDKVVRYCNLDMESYDMSKVSETNPLEIYREIKKSYLVWKRPEKMYIDFTGGTKAMSVAAAMAGAMIHVQLLYLGSSDYLADFRKPNPGSETLFYIINPLAVFGDLEIEKALELFKEYNYSGAQEKLQVLKESIPDPNIRQEMNFAYLLAKVYEAWDALDFVPAYETIVQLNNQLKRDQIMHGTFLLMDFYKNLKIQEEILRQLQQIPVMIKERKNADILKNKKLMAALMFTMHQSALIREKQEKYDMATLLLYRLLEMMEQRRLEKYNLYVSGMNYKGIKYNIAGCPEFEGKTAEEQLLILKRKVLGIRENVFGRNANDYLSEQVSLLDGFILLNALGDPLVCDENGSGINKLKRIRSMVFLRNNSIFAHGLGPVGQDDFLKFKAFVINMFKEFCGIERIDYQSLQQAITWLNPMDSKNYTVHMEGK